MLSGFAQGDVWPRVVELASQCSGAAPVARAGSTGPALLISNAHTGSPDPALLTGDLAVRLEQTGHAADCSTALACDTLGIDTDMAALYNRLPDLHKGVLGSE